MSFNFFNVLDSFKNIIVINQHFFKNINDFTLKFSAVWMYACILKSEKQQQQQN